MMLKNKLFFQKTKLLELSNPISNFRVKSKYFLIAQIKILEKNIKKTQKLLSSTSSGPKIDQFSIKNLKNY